jgi:hypothetical protein
MLNLYVHIKFWMYVILKHIVSHASLPGFSRTRNGQQTLVEVQMSHPKHAPVLHFKISFSK